MGHLPHSWYSFTNLPKPLSLSLVAKSCSTLSASWAVACQAPLSVEFSRLAHWSGLPFPTPGDLPDPGIKPASPALQAGSLPLSHQGSPCVQ